MKTNRRTENSKCVSNSIRLTSSVLLHFFRSFRHAIFLSLALLLSPSLASAYQVSAGGNHTCAIDNNGATCWGYNDFGQTDVPELSNPIQASLGKNHTCFLDDNGVKCSGRNPDGQINVPALSNPTLISAGKNHTCTIDDSGVVCWGNNASGQNNVPVLANPTQISAGDSYTCAIDDSGVVCWGRDAFGQKVAPELVTNPTQVTAGYGHTCIIDETGDTGGSRALCWGQNSFGQSTVPALSNPTQIVAGSRHTCALDDSGVTCWGLNGYGQITVPALSNPTQVTVGFGHTCALDDSGVVCWGWNSQGQSTVDSSLDFTATTATNGSCGASHDQVFTSTPTENLCATGVSSAISGSDPWAWSCAGTNGGSDASCKTKTAPTPEPAVNGSCGTSHEQIFTSIPTDNLCSTGISSAISGSDPWTWSCAGTNGGSDASCLTKTATTPVPAINGSCGTSHQKVFTSIPTDNLCSTGISSTISGTDPWTWSCAGTNGGSNASCLTKTAATPVPVVNGSCGTSHEQVFNSIPTENLCSTGVSSTITGTNPWAWSCSGTSGGSNASCSTIRTGQEENQIKFIERFYQNILNRVADSAELDYWLNIIQNESGATVAFGFFNSNEFNDLALDDTAFINILYQTLFGRQSDQGGFDFWMAQLTAGTLRETVIQGFVRSQEFSDLANSFGVIPLSDKDNTLFQIESFIERFYDLVLNRKPDIDGFNYWSDQLTDPDGSQSAGDIARGFFQSDEFVGRQTSDSEFTDIAYRAFFDREADATGKNYWLSELSAGANRLDVVNGFIASQEFIDFANRYGIRAD